MTSGYGMSTSPGRSRSGFSAGRLWAGGVGTAVVAALIVIVGMMLGRGILKIDVITPHSDGAYGGDATTTYALCAAGAALLATALLHLLMVAMPRPIQFFNWITGPATAAAALVPFTVTSDLVSATSSAVINLAVGVAIVTILPSVAGASLRRY